MISTNSSFSYLDIPIKTFYWFRTLFLFFVFLFLCCYYYLGHEVPDVVVVLCLCMGGFREVVFLAWEIAFVYHLALLFQTELNIHFNSLLLTLKIKQKFILWL